MRNVQDRGFLRSAISARRFSGTLEQKSRRCGKGKMKFHNADYHPQYGKTTFKNLHCSGFCTQKPAISLCISLISCYNIVQVVFCLSVLAYPGNRQGLYYK